MDYRQEIINEALRAGVPPEVALSVAQQESGMRQYANGQLIVGGAGEIGMFQVKPAAGAEVGVYNLADPRQNIIAGVSYLRDMYALTGSWGEALAAYNGGPGNWARGTVSPEARSYSVQVLNRVGTQTPGASSSWTAPQVSYPWEGGEVVFTAGVTELASPTALLLILGLLAALTVSRV